MDRNAYIHGYPHSVIRVTEDTGAPHSKDRSSNAGKGYQSQGQQNSRSSTGSHIYRPVPQKHNIPLQHYQQQQPQRNQQESESDSDQEEKIYLVPHPDYHPVSQSVGTQPIGVQYSQPHYQQSQLPTHTPFIPYPSTASLLQPHPIPTMSAKVMPTVEPQQQQQNVPHQPQQQGLSINNNNNNVQNSNLGGGTDMFGSSPFGTMGSTMPGGMSTQMDEMHKNMLRMQKQMEEQFRTFQIGGSGTVPMDGFGSMPRMEMPFPKFSDNTFPQQGMNTPGMNSNTFRPAMPTGVTPGPVAGSMQGTDTTDSLIREGRDGKKQLKLQVQMPAFKPDEIQVKKEKNKVEVRALHEEKQPDRVSCRVFHHQYTLPKDVRVAKMESKIGPDGTLVVEGQVKPRHRVKFSGQNEYSQ